MAQQKKRRKKLKVDTIHLRKRKAEADVLQKDVRQENQKKKKEIINENNWS